MKKWMALLCAVAMTLTLFAACSGREDEVVEPDDEPETSTVDPNYVPTLEEARENNREINDADISLLQFQDVRTGDTIAIVHTSIGDITIKLFPDEAPLAVNNFIALAEEGFYNGKVFHSIERDILVEAGSLDNNGNGGRSIYTDDSGNTVPFDNEYSLDLWHFYGAVSMVNDESGANTNLSQFFVVTASNLSSAMIEQMEEAYWPNKVVDRYREVGGTPIFDARRTVFGQVVDGLDVLEEINNAEMEEVVDPDSGEMVPGTLPLEDIIIESVTIASVE